ncbi:MAG TPA: hypothetical protein VF423_04285, partial [Actinomycetes bacterium]
APHLERRQRSIRRRTITAVAASVLALVVTTSIVLAGLRDHEESLPAPPAPDLSYSPSGLPVGRLVGKVDRTEPQARSTVLLVVRPDGSGTFNAGTVGDSAGDSTDDHDVEIIRDGPGSATMNHDGWCPGTTALNFDFTVQGRTVVITDAGITSGCWEGRGLASDLPGTTMRIRPLP